jgi:hypothetical protein
MSDSRLFSPLRTGWAALALTVVLAGCDPLSLASMFSQSAAGGSVLTLLDTDGRQLEIGDEVQGALSGSDYLGLNESYLEAWSLDGEAGQTVSIDLLADGFDSYLYLVGPGLNEPLRDDDSGGACHARIDYTFLESGVFRVVASSTSSRQTGTYRLIVSESARPRANVTCGGIDGLTLTALPTDGRELRVGERGFGSLSGVEASIQDGRPVQAWALDGEAGERVTISLESDDYDAYLYVFGPGMTETMTNDDGGEGLDSELTVTFPETGTFTIGAGALSAGSTGAYTLTVTEPIELITLSTRGRVLRVGSDTPGMLLDTDPTVEGHRVQAWSFEARAGESVTIDLTSDDFDSYLQIVGPGLSQLTDDDSGDGLNSRLSVSFPEDGVYRVIASSLGGDSGRFTLRLR